MSSTDGNPGVSETVVEMAMESDPAAWAAVQLCKSIADPPKTIGEVQDRIRPILRDAIRMELRRQFEEADKERLCFYEIIEPQHSKHPWRLSMDDGEHPTIDAPIRNTTLPGRVGVGVCQFHMLDVEDGGIDPDDADGEQGANIALVLTAPQLLDAAQLAIRECSKVLTTLQYMDPLLFSNAVIANVERAENAIENLREKVRDATDTGFIDRNNAGE